MSKQIAAVGPKDVDAKDKVAEAHFHAAQARPHMSLRWPLPPQDQQRSSLIQLKWLPRTPGMAAGLNDHVRPF